jgi:hypothetical protein
VARWIRGNLGAGQIPFPGLIALFVLAFIILGCIGIGELGFYNMLRDEPDASRRAIVRDATNDQYFRALLANQGISQSTVVRPSAKLRNILNELGGDGSIVFVAPRAVAENHVMFQLVRTISLPRTVIGAFCDTRETAEKIEKRVSAYVLYQIEPPLKVQNVHSFAPELWIFPAEEGSSWTTFCSR